MNISIMIAKAWNSQYTTQINFNCIHLPFDVSIYLWYLDLCFAKAGLDLQGFSHSGQLKHNPSRCWVSMCSLTWSFRPRLLQTLHSHIPSAVLSIFSSTFSFTSEKLSESDVSTFAMTLFSGLLCWNLDLCWANRFLELKKKLHIMGPTFMSC